MSLFDLITENEKQAFDCYREDFATGVGKKRHDKRNSCEIVLQPWADAKSDLLSTLFNGSLILEKEIKIEKDRCFLGSEWDELIYSGGRHPFLAEYYQKIIYSEDKDFELVKDSEGRPSLDWDHRSILERMTRTSWILENKVVSRIKSFTIKNPENGKTFTISDGMKTMKAFAKIAEAYDFNMEYFEDFRLKQSQILNQKHFTGTLCLSIHPLDYATMSDNKNNWSSCMSWREEGCYRQGTVEMMNSSNVIVAYLKDRSKTLDIGALKWNSKKWRELFIVDRNFISGIKGYPYWSSELEVEVINWVKDLMKLYYNEDYYPVSNFHVQEPLTIENKTFDFDFTTDYMYNDFHCNADYSIAVNTNLAAGNYDYCYSGVSECMWCGDTALDIDREFTLACDNCCSYERCSCCGDIISDEDAVVWEGDVPYCRYCHSNNVHKNIITNETICSEDNDVKSYYLLMDFPNIVLQGTYGIHVHDEDDISQMFIDEKPVFKYSKNRTLIDYKNLKPEWQDKVLKMILNKYEEVCDLERYSFAGTEDNNSLAELMGSRTWRDWLYTWRVNQIFDSKEELEKELEMWRRPLDWISTVSNIGF